MLGTFSTNVLTVTAAYAAVANGGYQVTPTGVLAVVDGYGQVRETFFDGQRTRVIPQKCIEPTRSVLSEVVQTGTGRGAALHKWKAFGKTGTTTANADAWFIGWSEGRVLGTWMGKRRDAVGEGRIAGKDAPANFFRRVSTSVNEMAEYRRKLQMRKQDVVGAREPRVPTPAPKRTPDRRKSPNDLSPTKRSAGLKVGIDLPGGDYRTVLNIDQRECERTCEQDRRCQAFTYNRRVAWCYLKNSVGPAVKRADSVSRIVRETTGAVPRSMTQMRTPATMH